MALGFRKLASESIDAALTFGDREWDVAGENAGLSVLHEVWPSTPLRIDSDSGDVTCAPACSSLVRRPDVLRTGRTSSNSISLTCTRSSSSGPFPGTLSIGTCGSELSRDGRPVEFFARRVDIDNFDRKEMLRPSGVGEELEPGWTNDGTVRSDRSRSGSSAWVVDLRIGLGLVGEPSRFSLDVRDVDTSIRGPFTSF